VVSLHLRYPLHPRNLRFPWQLFFLTTDDTDVHRLRTFGSTLMWFLLICVILFISAICGSPVKEYVCMRRKGLFLWMALLAGAGLYAQNAESVFETDGSGTITAYRGGGGAAVIPAQLGGRPVTGIGEKAFADSGLTSVTIPDRVTAIGEGAFANNPLTSVTIPGSVAVIGTEAFYNNHLTSVTIPGGAEIGRHAFYHSGTIKRLTLGSNIVFGPDAFSGPDTGAEWTGMNFFLDYMCNDRKAGTYTADSREPPVKQDGDFPYAETKYGAFIIGYTGSSGDGLRIPDRVNGLAVKAFTGFKGISRAHIPASVTAIVDGAFAGNRLTEIAIPASVTYIGMEAFEGNQLVSVTIPDGVLYIGDGAFANNQLTSVTIPGGVTAIGYGAFAGNQLTSVTIPGSAAVIGTEAFISNQLTSVAIGKGVSAIGVRAFEGNHLTGVVIPDSVTAIGYSAFAGNRLTSVSIGRGVTGIDDSAFADNRLTSVTIPAGVTAIGDNAFADNQLTRITIGAGVRLGNGHGTAFSDDFDRFYNGGGRRAGTYTNTTPDYWSESWAYTAR
jgi:GH24 family phage-related lysozyme (muramidase)